LEPAELRTAILAAARDAGADAVRIAPAEPLDSAKNRLADAFARGDCATWPYDTAYAARASDPGALLSDARSVVCIAVAYATPKTPAERGRGRVSNYAWSPDYHRTMRALLARIANRFDELAGGAVTRPACDTAPIAERAFAERSGLGWIGKHTNLIAPGLGSYVFLGEIVTTLELPPDERERLDRRLHHCFNIEIAVKSRSRTNAARFINCLIVRNKTSFLTGFVRYALAPEANADSFSSSTDTTMTGKDAVSGFRRTSLNICHPFSPGSSKSSVTTSGPSSRSLTKPSSTDAAVAV